MQELMLLTLEVRRRHQLDMELRMARQQLLDEALGYDPFAPRTSVLRPALRVLGRGMVASGRLLMRLGGDVAGSQTASSRTTMTMSKI